MKWVTKTYNKLTLNDHMTAISNILDKYDDILADSSDLPKEFKSNAEKVFEKLKAFNVIDSKGSDEQLIEDNLQLKQELQSLKYALEISNAQLDLFKETHAVELKQKLKEIHMLSDIDD